MAASQPAGTVSSLSHEQESPPLRRGEPDVERRHLAALRRGVDPPHARPAGCRRAWSAKIAAEASVEPLSASRISHDPSQTWAVRLSSVSPSVAAPL